VGDENNSLAALTLLSSPSLMLKTIEKGDLRTLGELAVFDLAHDKLGVRVLITKVHGHIEVARLGPGLIGVTSRIVNAYPKSGDVTIVTLELWVLNQTTNKGSIIL
jgi:hypothetical protein